MPESVTYLMQDLERALAFLDSFESIEDTGLKRRLLDRAESLYASSRSSAADIAVHSAPELHRKLEVLRLRLVLAYARAAKDGRDPQSVDKS